MKNVSRGFGGLAVILVLSLGMAVAQTSAARYDQDIQVKVSHQLSEKKQFSNVKSSVEDGHADRHG
jgi:cell division protein FtsL